MFLARQTYRTIGQSYGISAERVRQILVKEIPNKPPRFRAKKPKLSVNRMTDEQIIESATLRAQILRGLHIYTRPPYANTITKEECLASLIKASQQLGHLPTVDEYISLHLKPCNSTIIARFIRWTIAISTARLYIETCNIKLGGE